MSTAIMPVPVQTPVLSDNGLMNERWVAFLERLRSRRTAPASGSGALLDEVTLASDSTVAGPGAPSGDGDFLVEAITQDSTGGWEIAWGADFMPLSPTSVSLKAHSVTLFVFTGIGGAWWPVSPGIFLEP